MDDVLLDFQDFGFQYHAQSEPTLQHIDLKVRKGEKILIAGPSGCGKSTLAHCINGLIPFSYRGTMTGSLKLKKQETKDLGLFEIAKTVGTVLQDSDGQFIGLTVAEDIAFALENDCVKEPELHGRVKQAAGLVGMEGYLSHAPADLSGGQKQRIALAGILVNEVEVLLFDEPLANLDPAAGKSAIDQIDRMHRQTGAAVIIIEHRLEDVLYRSVDRIILMGEGRILADLSPDQLLSTDLLTQSGIREPLYLTALRYAGVEITPEKKPAGIYSLQLSDEDCARVRTWMHENPPKPAGKQTRNLLEVRNIRFAYANGHEALKDVSVSVREGELLAVVGTNGAGKSTFAKVVCGFETPQEGEIRFADVEDWQTLSIKERADYIGYVMQNPNQMISQTMIFDEVALGLRTRGVPEEIIRPRVEKTLTICGLYPFRNWPVSALSYGQKKRVTIASILVLKPKMIILDEPTAGQDYHHYTEIMEFLRQLGESGVTVVMITHDMHLMLEYADRSVVFSDGKVICTDTSAGILTNPDVVRQASLKETSLYDLAMRCGIEDARGFAQRFIDYEREVFRP